MNAGSGVGAGWPADVIHVNEDGWVLINRGAAQGVPVGLRLLVVGPSIRAMRDLFVANPDTDTGAQPQPQPEAPTVLRLRRTYELLEVVHVEEQCAVAIAARAPTERRPQFYRGQEGELLVWVPLPADYTWPLPDTDATGEDDATTDAGANDDASTTYGDTSEEGAGDVAGDVASDVVGDVVGDVDSADGADTAADGEAPDEPPERITQEDERWEEALPLNGISVGDRVVPALPAMPASGMTGSTDATDASGASTDPNVPDWMKPS